MSEFAVSSDMVEDASPAAENMIESMRHFGYELSTAVADLIDNSVTHNARNVWMDFKWSGPESWFTIIDDGDGMDDQTLFEAMRPSSRSPLTKRPKNDLGRFGLGLKTASFSQCRRLTVFSKVMGNKQTSRTWDLDFVAQQKSWALIKGCLPDSKRRALKFSKFGKGTLILWEKMDRIVDDRDPSDPDAKNEFYRKFDQCGRHISMVFHRFMGAGKTGIKFHLNGKQLKPWDPFLESKSEQIGNDRISHSNVIIECDSWVLPHHSKLSEEEHAEAAGIHGWNDHQGFYLYRNRRLIIAGGWLDLGLKTEEHCKLSRIRVDVPNSLDQEFQFDVLKSQAQVPAKLRKRFRALARDARAKATEVYRWRGKREVRNRSEPISAPVWTVSETRLKKYSFRVSQKHPLIDELRAALNKEQKVLLGQVLSLLEETVPTEYAKIRESEEPASRASPFEGKSEEEVLGIIKKMYEILRRDTTHQIAVRLISDSPGLGEYPELIGRGCESDSQ